MFCVSLVYCRLICFVFGHKNQKQISFYLINCLFYKRKYFNKKENSLLFSVSYILVINFRVLNIRIYFFYILYSKSMFSTKNNSVFCFFLSYFLIDLLCLLLTISELYMTSHLFFKTYRIFLIVSKFTSNPFSDCLRIDFSLSGF